MTPSFTVTLLFWALLACGALAVALDTQSHQLFRSSWKTLCLVLLATLLWRVPWNGTFFHGLEYEDSYVYTVAGRQMAEHVHPPPNDVDPPFSLSVCALGSIQDCMLWENFPEHLIGFPYVISLVARIVGYTPAVGSILNIVASLFSAVLVFMLTLTIAGDPSVALLSGLLFAAVPVFAVYGLETSAEPFSCCCMLLALWFCCRLWRTEAVSVVAQSFGWCAYTAALLFGQTVKREDALLALTLPIIMLLIVSRRDIRVRGRVLWMGLMIVSSLLALLLGFKMHLLVTSQNEQELLRQFPFTGARLSRFIWSFLESFGVLRWYGGTFLAVLAGTIVAFSKRNFALVPVILLGAFIAVYASHIRGYYEMESGQVSPESALRFSMNLMGLWAITGGLGFGWLVRRLQRHHQLRPKQESTQHFLRAAGATLLLASVVTTFYLRRDAVEDETKSRFTPALAGVEAASLEGPYPTFILTMDPLVIQMVSSTSTRIVDLESLNMKMVDELVASKAKLLLLKQNDRFLDADLKRYGEPIQRVLALCSRRLDVDAGFTVSLIDHRQNQPEKISQEQH